VVIPLLRPLATLVRSLADFGSVHRKDRHGSGEFAVAFELHRA
jgi:hypothetical protein